ncbi:hypothetical protein EJ07DRAFT_94352, partial [Lizonia empirigonia]
LGELQRAMDPLIAVQVYNNRFCPLISQLPEELLLCVCDFLRDDFAALLCLRIASRIFLRLLNSKRIFVWGSKCSIRGEDFNPHKALRLRFRELLQRDGRCNTCKRWNATHDSRLQDDCKFQQKFCGNSLRSRVHCDACDSLQDVFQFSQQSVWHQPKRQCLGQQGSVQLCAHVSITWARIKVHIDDWRQNQRGEGDWQACFDSFKIECHDPSHNTRCTGSEAPTWPRARLATSTRDPDIVVLNLEWKPHGRIATLALTADGRIPAPELRAFIVPEASPQFWRASRDGILLSIFAHKSFRSL